MICPECNGLLLEVDGYETVLRCSQCGEYFDKCYLTRFG